MEISPILIDELLSHAREGVNAHYIHPPMTKLREASQRIADYMIGKSCLDPTKTLVATW